MISIDTELGTIQLYSSEDIAQEKGCSLEAVQKAAIRLNFPRPGQGRQWQFTDEQRGKLLSEIGERPGPKTEA